MYMEGRWGGRQVLELENLMTAIVYQLLSKMKICISLTQLWK